MPGLNPPFRNSSVLACVAFVALAAGADCARPAGAFSNSGDTAYVGVAVGLQSPERYVNVFKGVQLALDELNASRPAGAPPLALRKAPENAKAPVDVATAFRDDPRVVGVVGHTESDPTISAAPVYDDRAHGGRGAVVAISPTASGREVTLASDWIFRVAPVVDRQAEIIARYMVDSAKLKRLAIIYRNDVSGREFLRTFAASTHGAALLERDPFVEEIAEFDLYAKRLARENPDGVAIFANTSDVLRIIRALRANGITPIAVSTNGPSARDLAADTVSARDFRGLRFLSLYAAQNNTTAAGQRFAASYAQHFGGAPDHWAALSYDAAELIGRAVQSVGADRHRVRDWIARVGRDAPAYEGATGVIRFDESRNPIEKAGVITVVGR
jgi:branched-chain amino acid transport system substrate-binding protein